MHKWKKVLLFVFILFLGVHYALAGMVSIDRISLSGVGVEGDSDSSGPIISGNGRYVVFGSFAANLVPGDTNSKYDIFIYDILTQTIDILSKNSLGVLSNNNSETPYITPDGRYISFTSLATNLVDGDMNAFEDIFVLDRNTNSVERVSVSTTGGEPNNRSYYSSLSNDGRYVAFESTASNLVAGDTNGKSDVFVYDRDLDTTEIVSVSDAGVQGNQISDRASISADGRYVAFRSSATNLVPNDTNGKTDIFVYDRDLDTIEMVSVNASGEQGNNSSFFPIISADGRYVAYTSNATNIITGTPGNVFLYDRVAHSVELISKNDNGDAGDSISSLISISKTNPRYTAFYSGASNLVTNYSGVFSDVYIRDRERNHTEQISVSIDGASGDNASESWPSLSNDGTRIVFDSYASNLVPNDTGGYMDIFLVVFDWDPPQILQTSANPGTTSVTIEWTTDEASSSQVEYGYHDSYGTTTSETDTAPRVTSHSVTLSGLVICTEYNYRVISKDAGKNTTFGTNRTFTTGGCSSSGGGGAVLIIPPPIVTPPVITPINPVIPTVEIKPTKDTPLILPDTTKTKVVVETIKPKVTLPKTETKTNPKKDQVEPTKLTHNTIPVTPATKNLSFLNSTRQTLQNSGYVLSATKKNIQNILESKEGDIATKTITLVGVVSGAAVALTSVLFATPLSFSEIALIPFRVWSLFLGVFGLRKRIRRWGVVYDALTKEPLDPAYVVLKNMAGKEIASTITDLDGRYGFLVQPGTYAITVSKSNYNFPSVKLAGKQSDELYDNLYFGDYFTINNYGEVITKNIPLDPVAFDWNEFEKNKKHVMNFYKKQDVWVARFSNMLFSLGFFLATIAFLVVPKPYNFIIFTFYLLVILLRIIGIRISKKGNIVEKNTGIPLSYAIVRVYYPGLDQEITHAVANARGDFYALMQNGVYQVKIFKKNSDESYTEVYNNNQVKVTKGVLNNTFEV